MPMTMHYHSMVCEMLQPTDEPTAVDERCPDALGQILCRSGIFDDVMVQSHDPTGACILFGDYSKGVGLFGRYKAERIGEREMSLGVGVQHDDPQPIVRVWRQDHGEDRRPQTSQRSRQTHRTVVCK